VDSDQRRATRRNPAKPNARAGFTLLELMLSLALTSLILVAVGMALDLHMRSYRERRSVIEQAQLARTILRIVADDIRAAVNYEEPDLAGFEKMVAGLSTGGGEVGDSAEITGATDVGTSEAGSATSGSDDTDVASFEDETALNSQDLAASTTIPSTPGIYGNQYELQIDVSRLPRVEEYHPLLSADPLAAMLDVPSDVKTVTYYVQSAGMVTQDAGTLGTTGTGFSSSSSFGSESSLFAENPAEASGGLVRRELDRSVTQWAIESGNAMGLSQAGEVIAPEVVAIEFRYFDGLQWLTEWDMTLQASLPLAIEVMLAMRPYDSQWRPASENADAAIMTTAQEGLRYYRMIVHVPTGQPSDGSTSGGMGLPDASSDATSSGAAL